MALSVVRNTEQIDGFISRTQYGAMTQTTRVSTVVLVW